MSRSTSGSRSRSPTRPAPPAQPKGVTLPHRARTLIFYAMAVEYGCYSPDDRALAVAPLCHGAGFAFAMAPVYFGGYCEIIRRFEPDRILDQLNAAAASNIFLVPTHFHAIFALEKSILARYRRDALRTIISNAAPLRAGDQGEDRRLLRRRSAARDLWLDRKRDRLQPPPAGSAAQDQMRRPAVPEHRGARARCRRQRGRSATTVGELFSRSPYHYNGYWGRAEETRATFRGDWFSAGDMARRDERRLHLPRRSQEGPRHLRRHQRLSARDRGSAVRASGRCRGRGHRRARRLLGRGAESLRRRPSRCLAKRGRSARALPRSLAGYKIPKTVEFIGGPAAQHRRQGAEDRTCARACKG